MADTVTAYSTDEDLVPVYAANAAALPETLAPLHAEAYAQIRRDLGALDWSVEELDALTDATREALKVPACHFVMYLLNRAQTHVRADSGVLELAKFHLGEYQRALRSTSVESTIQYGADDGPRSTGGYVVLA